MNSNLQDAVNREHILRCLDQNFFVEAGAGSGKTASLVGRMLSMVKSPNFKIEEIVAITFTRKAAGELKERFQIEMEKALQNETDPAIKQRLHQGLNHLDQCFIGTIHSFCSALLRERPVEAGLSPDFTEIEGLDELLLEKRAWGEYIVSFDLNNPGKVDELRKHNLSLDMLFRAYQRLNKYPDVEKHYSPQPFPVIEPWYRQCLEDMVKAAQPYMPDDEPARGWDSLQDKIRRIDRWQYLYDLNDDLTFLRLLAELNRKKAAVTLNRWLSNDGAREAKAAYEVFDQKIIQPMLTQWHEHRYEILMEAVLPACDYYSQVRTNENCLNFEDLLMRCAALLRDNPEVRNYFQNRFRTILVDEFQDTDPVQAEIMVYLTGSDINEKDWKKLRPVSGSLFVVGDPKQSIYRFRRADIDTFHQVRQQIVDSGGEVLSLSSNFRSMPEIIDWVNPCFNDLFSRSSAPYQSSYLSMGAVRPAEPGSHSGVAVVKLPPKHDLFKADALYDAAQIAGWIQQALAGSIHLARSLDEKAAGLDAKAVPEDFLILMRNKGDLALYARALETAGIPYSIAGASDLSRSVYIWELYYLLLTLVDPQNQVTLVTCMRGLLFGVSDQVLYDYVRDGGRFSIWSTSQAVKNHPEVERVYHDLKRYLLYISEMPASAAISKISEELGLVPLAATEELGNSQVSALMQLLEIIRHQEQQGKNHFADLVDFIGILLTEGLEDEINIDGYANRGVRLMNLHKAKGLEASVVILANPWHHKEWEPEYHVSRQGPTAQAYLQIRRPTGEYSSEVVAQPANWTGYSQEEASYQEAEQIRLLYVAATRAKNLLVIVTNADKPQNSPWFELEQYLHTAQVYPPAAAVSVPKARVNDKKIRNNLAACRQKISDDISKISEPSYAHKAVSHEAKQTQAGPQREHTGKGRTWGNIIHRILERLALDSEYIKYDELLKAIIIQEGRDPGEFFEVKELLSMIIATPLWQRVQGAEQVLSEVPLGVWEGKTYHTGTIDLVFKETDGWVLVDYKTDSIIDEFHLGQLRDYYWPQVKAYQEYWEQISGERIKEIGLFFTAVGELIIEKLPQP